MTIFKDRIKYNSFIFTLLMFLYGLCTVTDLFVNMQIVIAVTTFMALIPALFLNRIESNLKLCIIYFLFFILFLFQLAIYPFQNDAIFTIMLSFSTIGVAALFIGSNEIDYSLIYKYGLKLAYINFVLVTIFLIVKSIDTDFSMRFGYAMLPSTIWFLFQIINERKILHIILFFVSLLMLVLWGSRGTLLVLMIIITLLMMRKNIILTLSAIGLIFLSRDKLISIFVEIIDKLPFDTFKSRKLIAMMTNDFWENSSGRDMIYNNSLNLIKNNPNGLGIGFWQDNTQLGNMYPHNIFLQIGCEFGIIGLLLFTIILIKLIIDIFKTKSQNEFIILSILFSLSIGRLMVSSEYWVRPEFWMLIGVLFIGKKYTKRNFYA